MKSLKRATLYLLIVIACAAAIGIRIAMVQAYRAHTIVSFYGEWEKRGKPVQTRTVLAQDVPVFNQFTVKVVDGKLARGFVTGEVKDALKVDQEIYGPDDRSVLIARVKSVSSELDTDTGMFPVEIVFEVPREEGGVSVVSAHTRTLANALAVSNEMLDISGGEYYLWKVKDGVAKKCKVGVGSRNGYGAIIVEGLASGEAVIFNGQSLLSDNDRVSEVK